MNKKISIVIILTFGLHALAIYSINDLPLTFSAIPRSFLSLLNQEVAENMTKEDFMQKEAWISAALNQLQTPKEIVKALNDFPEVQIDEIEIELSLDVQDPVLEQISLGDDDYLFTDYWEKPSPLLIYHDQPELPLRTLGIDDQTIIQKIMQATESTPRNYNSALVKDFTEIDHREIPSLSVGFEPMKFSEEYSHQTKEMDIAFIENQKTNIDNELDHLVDRDLIFSMPKHQFESEREKGTIQQLSSFFHSSTLSEQLETSVANSQAFNLDIEYARKSNGTYLFRLTFFPKPHYPFKKIAQNYFFLIDRSQSIPPEYYERSKSAVVAALKLLKADNTFNVLIFDRRIVKLSDHNLPSNFENISKAETFLNQQKHGGIFATTDLYSSLGDIVPKSVAENEVNTAILLSDGDTFISRENQRKTIGNWTKENSCKVSLFSVAEGKGNNLPLLNLLTAFNKGFLFYNSQPGSIGQTIVELIQLIRNPIGKDLTASAITANPSTKINLYPDKIRMPDLYEQIPYVIYGTIDEPTDFTIFLQGKYYDQSLDIKQKVCFQNGREVPVGNLDRKLALHQAYSFYDGYLQDGLISSVMQAKQLLAPYGIPVAFE